MQCSNIFFFYYLFFLIQQIQFSDRLILITSCSWFASRWRLQINCRKPRHNHCTATHFTSDGCWCFAVLQFFFHKYNNLIKAPIFTYGFEKLLWQYPWRTVLCEGWWSSLKMGFNKHWTHLRTLSNKNMTDYVRLVGVSIQVQQASGYQCQLRLQWSTQPIGGSINGQIL